MAKKENVVAVLTSEGTYNGFDYKNYILGTVIIVDGVPKFLDGKSYKFKSANIKSVTGYDDPMSLIGLEIIDSRFDKNGKLVEVKFADGK